MLLDICSLLDGFALILESQRYFIALAQRFTLQFGYNICDFVGIVEFGLGVVRRCIVGKFQALRNWQPEHSEGVRDVVECDVMRKMLDNDPIRNDIVANCTTATPRTCPSSVVSSKGRYDCICPDEDATQLAVSDGCVAAVALPSHPMH
jgi:hypothetical protein